MARFTHIAREKDEPSIRRGGVKPTAIGEGLRHYSTPHVPMTAAEAVAVILHADDPRGYEAGAASLVLGNRLLPLARSDRADPRSLGPALERAFRRTRGRVARCKDAAMTITWDKSADAAYIYLIPPEERVAGVAAQSVEFWTDANELLRALALDFDDDGRLVGIEVLSASRCLRESALDTATLL